MTDTATLTPRDRLIVALDVADTGSAERLAQTLEGQVGVFKIGLELAMNGGIGLARDLAADGHKVFLDLKLLDISNTVTKAVENAADQGYAFLTVHAYPAAMRAAVAGLGLQQPVPAGRHRPDLAQYRRPGGGRLRRCARGAGAEPRQGGEGRAHGRDRVFPARGCRGAPGRRQRADNRHAGRASRGQRERRPETRRHAGIGDPRRADYLVVGRPITQSLDPASAAAEIVTEIATAL